MVKPEYTSSGIYFLNLNEFDRITEEYDKTSSTWRVFCYYNGGRAEYTGRNAEFIIRALEKEVYKPYVKLNEFAEYKS